MNIPVTMSCIIVGTSPNREKNNAWPRQNKESKPRFMDYDTATLVGTSTDTVQTRYLNGVFNEKYVVFT